MVEEINKHHGHKMSEDKVTIVGDDIVVSKYCFDCDVEFIINKKENKWTLEKDTICPHCGQPAITSTKYFKDEMLKTRKRKYIHCFSCDYTREDFVDED